MDYSKKQKGKVKPEASKTLPVPAVMQSFVSKYFVSKYFVSKYFVSKYFVSKYFVVLFQS